MKRTGLETSPNQTAQQSRPTTVILAAGKGTRMESDLPKVVHPVGGRAMVCAVVEACIAAGCGRIIVVVGYMQELVREALRGFGKTGLETCPTIEYAVQAEQHGTGHAVMCAEPLLANYTGEVFVLAGDGPLIRPQTLRTLLARHRAAGAAASIATSVIDDPTGYGRIVRDAAGRFRAIVEHKVATPEQRSIREVNPSYYCFRAPALFGALKRVERNPVSQEYYITDTLELLLRDGQRVEVVEAVPPEDVLSINTPAELARVDAIYRARSTAAAASAPSALGAVA